MIKSANLKIFLAALPALALASLATAQIEYDRSNFWSKPYIRDAWLGSYELNTKLEPSLSEEEQVLFKELIELLQMDDREAALNLLLPELNEDASAALDFIAGSLYAEKGERETAMRYLSQAVDKFPNFQRARRNLGIMLAQQGKYEDSLEQLTKVVELGANDTTTFGLIGLAYVNTDRYIAAETSYRQAMVLNPGILDWKEGLVKALMLQEKYNEAITLIDEILLEEPDKESLWMAQANAYLGLEQPEMAVANHEIVYRMGKAKPESLVFMGNIYMSRDLPDLAIKYYREAISMDPEQSPDTYLDVASTLVSRGAFDKGRSFIDRIRNTFSDRLENEQRLRLLRLEAQIGIAMGEGEKVIPILERILRRDPTDGRALLMLAEHYSSKETLDGYEQADLYYERLVKIPEYEVRGLVSWARSYVQRGKYGEAVPLLERANTKDPKDYIGRYLEQVRRVHLANI